MSKKPETETVSVATPITFGSFSFGASSPAPSTEPSGSIFASPTASALELSKSPVKFSSEKSEVDEEDDDNYEDEEDGNLACLT